MASTQASGPWEAPTDTIGTPWAEATFRGYYGRAIGDGVLGDTSGLGLRVTCDGTGQVASVAVGWGSVGGHWYQLSGDPLALDMSAVGTPTTAGQSRIDVIGLLLDTAVTSSATRVKGVVIPGTPGANPTVPSYSRSLSGNRLLPLASVRRLHGTAPTQAAVTDLRTWIGWNFHARGTSTLPTDAPIGSVGVAGGQMWARRYTSTGALWVPAGGGIFADLTLNADLTWTGGQSDVTKLGQWRANAYHDGALWPHSTGSVIRAPYSGTYMVSAQLRGHVAGGDGSGQITALDIRKNATSVDDGARVSFVNERIDGVTYRNLTVTPRCVALAAGDWLRVYATSGGGVEIPANSGMQYLTARLERLSE